MQQFLTFYHLTGKYVRIPLPGVLNPVSNYYREEHPVSWVLFLCAEREVSQMAKGKYEYWLTPEGLLKIEGWARDGLTDEQIASNIGITAKTLYEWKKRFGDICESLKKGKEVVDRQVENALLKRALGYEYEEIKEKFELK